MIRAEIAKVRKTMSIPTINLSPFLIPGDEYGRKKAMETIREACAKYGFFQIENHGVPLDLMDQAMELAKTFFNYPKEVKREASCKEDASRPLPVGYIELPQLSHENFEHVLMFQPESPFNVFPANPPDFKTSLEKLFKYFVKTAQLLEEIINECLGLPRNFLKVYNDDRSWDFMSVLSYPPSIETGTNGLYEHEDGNLITIIFQDDVGGLEVRKDGKWIPVIPSKGKLVVNISDVIQVLSNKKFKSATHRVIRSKGISRNSFAFFYTVKGDKWVEPLPKFTKEIGLKPKYKGFYYKDYQALRIRNETHPPLRIQDNKRITHYEIQA